MFAQAYVFLPGCGDVEATSLRSRSLARAREFIDDRMEIAAVFGKWFAPQNVDRNQFVTDWQNGLSVILGTAKADSLVCGATHGFSGSAYCGLIVVEAGPIGWIDKTLR